MITKEQIHFLARKNKISETIIFREYLQLFFLSELCAKDLKRVKNDVEDDVE